MSASASSATTLTASACSGSGAKKVSGSPLAGANASAWASRPSQPTRLRAQRPDHVWALDFQFDQTADGRVLKLLNVVDEFTREALAIHVARRIDADQTVNVLERLAHQRGAPAHVRCDNGPDLTAHALRDWCRFRHAGTASIEPGSPWQNAYVESFNGRLRDELLDVEQFSCHAEAVIVIEDWRQDYNAHRPHSALGNQAPTVYSPLPGEYAPRNQPRNHHYSDQNNIHRLSEAVDQSSGSGHYRLAQATRGHGVTPLTTSS